jgi:2-phosphoglycolate phosphatase
MKHLPEAPQGVLFDLHAALVAYCGEMDAPAPSYSTVREVISRGSRAILRCAFNESDEQLLERAPRYLELYHSMMSRHTRPFEGIDALLEALEASAVTWGIVTNKPGYLTDELVRQIGWSDRAAAVVSGDTLPVRKPDPAPVLLACERAGLQPSRCLFVGDDRRDIQAGNDAGLYSVAVHWGYLDGGDPYAWGADVVVEHPRQLAELLKLKVTA